MFKKVNFEKNRLTPLEAINVFKTKHNAKYIIEEVIERSVLKGTLEIDQDTFKAEYPIHKHAKYAKHKLATKLLEIASMTNDTAWELYVQLQKEYKFIKGRCFELNEGYLIKFKGDSDSMQFMHQDVVRNRTSDYGKVISAFLNTKGGRLYIGIHDKTKAIQGIKISDIDNFITTIQKPEGNLRIALHPVANFPTLNDNNTSAPIRSKDPCEYVTYIEQKLNDMSDYIENLPKSTSDVDLYVLEFKVMHTKDLTFFDG